MKKSPPKPLKSPRYQSAVLITGAGSGIGLAFTEDCLSRSDDKKIWGEYQVVVMVARQPTKLKATAARLRKKYGEGSPKIITLAVDLSRPGGVKKVMDGVNKNRLRVITLINNAGIGYMGKFTAMTEERFREIINLNITALTELSHAVLKHIQNFSDLDGLKTNPIIVNVASVVGILPFPLTSVYAASKAYVVSFSEALRVECQKEVRPGHGVEVYTLCPGSTRTAFFERAGKQIVDENKPQGLLATEHFMDPAQVVKETREAIACKQGFIIPGFFNRFIPILRRVLPHSWALRIAYRFMDRRLRR